MKRYISLSIEDEKYEELKEWCKAHSIYIITKEMFVTKKGLIRHFSIEGSTLDYQSLKEVFPDVSENGVARLGNILDCDSATLQTFCGILKAQEEAIKKEQFAESWFAEFLDKIDSVEALKEIENYRLTDGCRRMLALRLYIINH